MWSSVDTGSGSKRHSCKNNTSNILICWHRNQIAVLWIRNHDSQWNHDEFTLSVLLCIYNDKLIKQYHNPHAKGSLLE